MKAIPGLWLMLALLGWVTSVAGAQNAPTPTLAEKQSASFTVTVTGKGAPMLLIPGLASGGNAWDGTVAHFQDRYECHVFTLAGFAGVPLTGEFSLERVRDAIAAYIREKHFDHPVIIGHSLGGMLALWLGATMGEECGPVVALDGVPYFPALIDPSATPEVVKPRVEGMRRMMAMASAEQAAFGLRSSLAGMISDPKEMERIAVVAVKSDPKAVGQGIYEISTIDLRPKMSAVKAPVLLIGAAGAIPDAAMRTAAQGRYEAQVASIARHKVVVSQTAHHFVQLDEPDFFYRTVEEFLQEYAPDAAAK